MTGPQATEVGTWWLAGGLFVGILLGYHRMDWRPTSPVLLAWIAISASLLLLVLTRHRPILAATVGIAALTAGVAFGAAHRDREDALEAILDAPSQIAVRIRATAIEGWIRDRWGHRTRISLDRAARNLEEAKLPPTHRLEVRNVKDPTTLPAPGVPFEVLAEVKGPAESPLLVVAAPGLVRVNGAPRGAPALREFLVRRLIQGAGTDARRLRAAATAATLALGRRDLIPEHRREGWRRSGLAHAFAVSGLHVGVVSGVAWLCAVAAGMTPRRVRLLLLLVVPSYAIVAGASPSAVRAAGMVSLYLIARLLGRAVDPLASLFLAAFLLMVAEPSLALGPGFQLTVAVTAALIRWTSSLTKNLRGPNSLRNLVAAPVVAALASSPIVALHFGQVVPLGFAANLAAPLLLSLLIPAAVAATSAAVVAAPIAGILLDVIGCLDELLWWFGGLGRLWNPSVAPISHAVVVGLVAAGWIALRRRPFARWFAISWVVLWFSVLISQGLLAGPGSERVDALSVGDGSAILVSSGNDAVLLDGGRSFRQGHELLLAARVHHLAMVVVSHGDADHLGGLPEVLHRHTVGELVMPTWMASDPAAVPLIRVANSRGVAIRRMARGSRLDLGTLSASCLWPPATSLPEPENDRSLVLRVELPSGTVLTTGDIAAATESRLLRTTELDSDVLIAPHHGSNSSSTTAFLDAVNPDVVLIPAGPWNRYGHPHPAVLQRLRNRRLPYCAPVTDPLCRATPGESGWILAGGTLP